MLGHKLEYEDDELRTEKGMILPIYQLPESNVHLSARGRDTGLLEDRADRARDAVGHSTGTSVNIHEDFRASCRPGGQPYILRAKYLVGIFFVLEVHIGRGNSVPIRFDQVSVIKEDAGMDEFFIAPAHQLLAETNRLVNGRSGVYLEQNVSTLQIATE